MKVIVGGRAQNWEWVGKDGLEKMLLCIMEFNIYYMGYNIYHLSIIYTFIYL